MDIMQTLNAVVTTLVEYFRGFDFDKMGDFVKMIIDNFNVDTIKTTFTSLGAFIKDIYTMIKG